MSAVNGDGAGGSAAPAGSLEIGQRIRRERERRGMSLRELARRAELSPSLVSQIETGKSEPSVSSLVAIVGEIGLSLNELVFGEQPGSGDETPAAATPGPAPAHAPHGLSQEEGSRRTIHLNEHVTWERLTAEPDHDVDFLYVTYDVGGSSTPLGTLMRHQGKEYGFVMAGRLGVTVGFDHYEIGAGGSISFDSTVPHRLWNAGDEQVRAVWTVVGRGPAADAHTVDLG